MISLSASVAVRNTWSGVTTGDDRAKGTGAFQTTFFEALNSVGSAEASATPAPFGPRNCVHSLVALLCCACIEATTNNAIAVTKTGSDLFTFIFVNRASRKRTRTSFQASISGFLAANSRADASSRQQKFRRSETSSRIPVK